LRHVDPRNGRVLAGASGGRKDHPHQDGTGTGKTTLSNILARSIPNDQRIVTAVPSQRSLLSYLSQIRA
jgi:Flp pilus assembly CpaF family ATPase